MGTSSQISRCQSQTEADLEKQEINDPPDSPSRRDTTLVGDDDETPVSPKLLKRSITDYLRNISIPEKIPELFRRQTEPAYDEEQRITRIDSHPEGYPQLAAFMNSDENFSICRRFGFLHQRVLLYRQDELRALEDRLIRLDDEDAEDDPKLLKSRKLDDVKEGSLRRGLIQEIDEKLEEYVKVMQRMKFVSNCKTASARNYTSVSNWLHNKAPLSNEETEFIHHKADIIAIGDGEEQSWFDGFVEDTLSKVPCRFTRLLFTSPEQRSMTDDAYVHLYSKERINILVRLFICMLAVVLLMGPVALMLLVPTLSYVKLIIIMVFTLVFSVILSICTRARRHEVYGATAA